MANIPVFAFYLSLCFAPAKNLQSRDPVILLCILRPFEMGYLFILPLSCFAAGHEHCIDARTSVSPVTTWYLHSK